MAAGGQSARAFRVQRVKEAGAALGRAWRGPPPAEGVTPHPPDWFDLAVRYGSVTASLGLALGAGYGASMGAQKIKPSWDDVEPQRAERGIATALYGAGGAAAGIGLAVSAAIARCIRLRTIGGMAAMAAVAGGAFVLNEQKATIERQAHADRRAARLARENQQKAAERERAAQAATAAKAAKAAAAQQAQGAPGKPEKPDKPVNGRSVYLDEDGPIRRPP